MISQCNSQMNCLHLRLGVIPESCDSLQCSLAFSIYTYHQLETSHSFELPAHEQHTGPDASLRALLSRRSIEMALTISKKHICESSKTSMLFFIHLSIAMSTQSHMGSMSKYIPWRAGTKANLRLWPSRGVRYAVVARSCP
jgi:hypothetical protein